MEPVLRDDMRLDERSKRSVFWGTYFEPNQMPWLRFNAYYLGLNDQRSTVTGRQRTFSTFGMRLYEKPKTGQVDYEIESVWQTGKRGDTNHFAHFQHLDIGYSLDLPWSPRFLIHYDCASGDRNARDSQASTFDTLFGARRFEFSPTGNFEPFFRMNVSSPGWRVIVVPYQGWNVQLKRRVWYLATSRGTFASHGLHEGTGGSGNFLDQGIELWTRWKINSNLAFDSGYVHWFKGDYFDRLPVSGELPPGGNID